MTCRTPPPYLYDLPSTRRMSCILCPSHRPVKHGRLPLALGHTSYLRYHMYGSYVLHTGPSTTDGYDLSDAFRSPSASESPRTTAVIQHDVFLNSSSYRSVGNGDLLCFRTPAIKSEGSSGQPATALLTLQIARSRPGRSGCYKLVLGCPGGNVRYREPDHLLLRTVDEGR